MTGTAYPGDAVTGVPTYTATQGRSAFAAAMSGATAARPLGGLTGIRPGTPTTILTIPTNTTWQLTPFGGYIDLESPGTTGGYFFAFQANETGTIAAAAGSIRSDLLYVQINDSNTGDGSGLSPRVVTGVQTGVAGAGIPTLTVARAFVLAVITVPASGGGSPTFTWVTPFTVGAGATWPFLTAAQMNAVPGTQVGQRAEVFADTAANNGTYRWDGAAWKPWESAWIAYSPTLTGVTIGTGGSAQNVAAYKYELGRVRVRGVATLGTGGGFGVTGTIDATLPVTALALRHAYQGYPGFCEFFDVSAGVNYAAFAAAANASVTDFNIFYPGTSGARGGTSSSLPFVWATGDSISYDFTYDPA